MPEQAFGLSVNQVMAYAAVANVLLVIVLAAINVYYAWHARRQADASHEQVVASTRQAEIAAETLAILRKQLEQQRTADLATVTLQLKVAIHTVEDWLKRIASEGYPQLPDEIRILPADFSIATQRANAIDPIVAENMGAASLYSGEAENNLRILRSRNPAEPATWKAMQEKATKNLNNVRYKLSVARARWETMAEAPSQPVQ
jgi:cell division protein FtsL